MSESNLKKLKQKTWQIKLEKKVEAFRREQVERERVE
jgi:hypothetical protein